MYQRSLEEDIADETSGHFKKLLLLLLQTKRDPDGEVDPEAVAADVKALYKAGEKKLGTDEKVFTSILSSRSYVHLRAVFDKYQEERGKTFERVVKSEFSGDIEDALLAVIRVINNRTEFYAGLLHKAIDGLGTKDALLIRIIVSRLEKDIEEIKCAYQDLYGKSLYDDVAGDTSGNYRKSLLKLIRRDKGKKGTATTNEQEHQQQESKTEDDKLIDSEKKADDDDDKDKDKE